MGNEWSAIPDRMRKLEEDMRETNVKLESEVKRLADKIDVQFKVTVFLLTWVGMIFTAILAKLLGVIPG